ETIPRQNIDKISSEKLLSAFLILNSPLGVLGDIKEQESLLIIAAQNLCKSFNSLVFFYSQKEIKRSPDEEIELLKQFQENKSEYLRLFNLWEQGHKKHITKQLIDTYIKIEIKITELNMQSNTVLKKYHSLSYEDLMVNYKAQQIHLKAKIRQIGGEESLLLLQKELRAVEGIIEQVAIQSMTLESFWHEYVLDPNFAIRDKQKEQLQQVVAECIKRNFMQKESSQVFLKNLFNMMYFRLSQLTPHRLDIQERLRSELSILLLPSFIKHDRPEGASIAKAIVILLRHLQSLDSPENARVYEATLKELGNTPPSNTLFCRSFLLMLERVNRVEQESLLFKKHLLLPQIKSKAIQMEQESFKTHFNESKLVNLHDLFNASKKLLNHHEKEVFHSSQGPRFMQRKLICHLLCFSGEVSFKNCPETFFLDFKRLKSLQQRVELMRKKMLLQSICEQVLGRSLNFRERFLAFTCLEKQVEKLSPEKQAAAFRKLCLRMPIIICLKAKVPFTSDKADFLKKITKTVNDPNASMNKKIMELQEEAIIRLLSEEKMPLRFKKFSFYRYYLPELKSIALDLGKMLDLNYEVHHSVYQDIIDTHIQNDLLHELLSGESLDIYSVPTHLTRFADFFNELQEKVRKFITLLTGLSLSQQLISSQSTLLQSSSIKEETFVEGLKEAGFLDDIISTNKISLKEQSKKAVDLVRVLATRCKISIPKSQLDSLESVLLENAQKLCAQNLLESSVFKLLESKGIETQTIKPSKSIDPDQMLGVEGILAREVCSSTGSTHLCGQTNFLVINAMLTTCWQLLYQYGSEVNMQFFLSNHEIKESIKSAPSITVDGESVDVETLLQNPDYTSKDIRKWLLAFTRAQLENKGITIEENQMKKFQQMLFRASMLSSNTGSLHYKKHVKGILQKYQVGGEAIFKEGKQLMFERYHLENFISPLKSICRDVRNLYLRVISNIKRSSHTTAKAFLPIHNFKA
ncbi:MAG: hypothetical protein GWP59_08505, partial [Chlamydiales bacterium]|nr:hypothetical protein [Chlamydiales bacterium]